MIHLADTLHSGSLPPSHVALGIPVCWPCASLYLICQGEVVSNDDLPISQQAALDKEVDNAVTRTVNTCASPFASRYSTCGRADATWKCPTALASQGGSNSWVSMCRVVVRVCLIRTSQGEVAKRPACLTLVSQKMRWVWSDVGR